MQVSLLIRTGSQHFELSARALVQVNLGCRKDVEVELVFIGTIFYASSTVVEQIVFLKSGREVDNQDEGQPLLMKTCIALYPT